MIESLLSLLSKGDREGHEEQGRRGDAMTAGPEGHFARAPESATKGFGELEAEVVRTGRCSECRACVDLCAADGPGALELDHGAFTFRADECTECGLCYAVCPEVPWAWEDLRDDYDLDKSDIGHDRKITSAATRSAVVKARTADGGVATSLLWYLLDTGRIDGAILSRGDGLVGPNLFVARTRDEVLAASGTRASRGASLATGLGVITNLDLIAFLRSLHKEDPDSRERLAIVASPCQAYALRRLQQTGVAPAPRVTTVLGLFCYEALPLNKREWQRFEEATGLRVGEIEKVHLGEELVVTMKDGGTRHVDLDTASLLAGPNCLRCMDFTNWFADLSVGAVGSDPGFTTVVVRTEGGLSVFEGAIEAGYIVEWTTLFDKEGGKPLVRRIRAQLKDQTQRKIKLAHRAGIRRET